MQPEILQSDTVISRIKSDEKFKQASTPSMIEYLGAKTGISPAPDIKPLDISLEDQERISDALQLALALHIDQKDRPDGPYVNHVMRAATRVIDEYGVTDPDLIIAALLHDSIEDQAEKLAALYSGNEKSLTTREKALAVISNRFGKRVAHIVESLSNPEIENKEALDKEAKNRIYKEHVAHAIQEPDFALIKLADFSDNGLNLHTVTDTPRRLKLGDKYQQVIEVFIDRLQRDDINIPSNKKEELIARLKNARADIEAYRKANS